jgi:hypothetical protein
MLTREVRVGSEQRRTFRSSRSAQESFLRALADERSCERLIVAYAQLVDVGRIDLVVGLFACDGVWESDAGAWEGHDQIRRAMSALMSAGEQRRHVTSNINVRASGDEGDGLSYVAVYLGGGTEPSALGHFRDRFVRTAEGWRFAHRRLEITAGHLPF